MSRLRGNPSNHTCQQQLGFGPDGKERGICGLPAVIRCNACKAYFCEECWQDHFEMTAVVPLESRYKVSEVMPLEITPIPEER